MDTIFQYLYVILFWLLFGFLTASLAKRQGKNPRVWFFIGMLLGVLGVALILILPYFEAKPVKVEKTPPPVIEPILSPFWYYLTKEHEQRGPIDLDSLREKWNSKELQESSYVWSEGMEGWKRLHELPELFKTITS